MSLVEIVPMVLLALAVLCEMLLPLDDSRPVAGDIKKDPPPREGHIEIEYGGTKLP